MDSSTAHYRLSVKKLVSQPQFNVARFSRVFLFAYLDTNLWSHKSVFSWSATSASPSRVAISCISSMSIFDGSGCKIFQHVVLRIHTICRGHNLSSLLNRTKVNEMKYTYLWLYMNKQPYH